MSYSHKQQSCLYEYCLIYGSISIVAIVAGFTASFMTENYYLIACVSGFWYGATLLCQANKLKFLQICDNNNESLKISWNVPETKPSYHVELKYENIKSYSRTQGSCSSTMCYCCSNNDGKLLVINANGTGESCSCCCNGKCNNLDMIQFNLSTPYNYNCCGCKKDSSCYSQCCENNAEVIRVSTDDLNGLTQFLQSKSIEEVGVELRVGQTTTA